MNQAEGQEDRLERWKKWRAQFQRNTGWVLWICKHTGFHNQVDRIRCLEWEITERNGNVHERDAQGLQPIHHASGMGLVQCVDTLLKHGADPCGYTGSRGKFRRSGDGRMSPIDYAVWYCRDACIRRLIEAGATVSQKQEPGWATRFRQTRTAQRHAALVVLASRRRGALRGQDHFLVRNLAKRVWELRHLL